jgi:hypothetical protein
MPPATRLAREAKLPKRDKRCAGTFELFCVIGFPEIRDIGYTAQVTEWLRQIVWYAATSHYFVKLKGLYSRLLATLVALFGG